MDECFICNEISKQDIFLLSKVNSGETSLILTLVFLTWCQMLVRSLYVNLGEGISSYTGYKNTEKNVNPVLMVPFRCCDCAEAAWLNMC